VHPHAVVGEQLQEPGRGVAVGVVRPDGHERDPCPGRGEELRIGVCAAVVRHLEDVGGQVDTVAHEPSLRLGAEVPGEEDPQTVDGHPHDQGEVVRLTAGHRPVDAGREHLQVRRSEAQAIARLEERPRPRGAPQHGVEGG
jgi:hypothetical protein